MQHGERVWRGCACLGLRTALATPARWSAEASGDERAALSSAALASEYMREYVSKSVSESVVRARGLGVYHACAMHMCCAYVLWYHACAVHHAHVMCYACVHGRCVHCMYTARMCTPALNGVNNSSYCKDRYP